MNQRSQLPIDCPNQVAQHSVPSVLEAQVAPASPNSPTCASAWKAAAWHLPGKHGAVGQGPALGNNEGDTLLKKKQKDLYLIKLLRHTEAYWGHVWGISRSTQIPSKTSKLLLQLGVWKRRFWGSVSEYLVDESLWLSFTGEKILDFGKHAASVFGCCDKESEAQRRRHGNPASCPKGKN